LHWYPLASDEGRVGRKNTKQTALDLVRGRLGIDLWIAKMSAFAKMASMIFVVVTENLMLDGNGEPERGERYLGLWS